MNIKDFKGILLGVILGLIILGITFLLIGRIGKNQTFDYKLLNFDFIIPRPWYSQISELKALPFINNIVPYYMFYSNIENDENSFDVDLYMLEEFSDMPGTPFLINSTSDSIPNSKTSTIPGVYIDNNLCNLMKCKQNDIINLNIAGTMMKFLIIGTLKETPFSHEPPCVIEFKGNVRDTVKNQVNRLAYSGAYVRTSDYSAGEQYFFNEYRPLGKVGDPTWYPDQTSYEFMYNSISSESVKNEVQSIHNLEALQNSDIKQFHKVIIQRFVIIAIVMFLIWIASWSAFIFGHREIDKNNIRLGISESRIRNAYIGEEILGILIAAFGSFAVNKFGAIYVLIYLALLIIVFIVELIITISLLHTRKEIQKK